MKDLRITVTGENDTDFEVQWEEPESLNGNLDGYFVEVVDTTDDNKRQTFWLNKTESFTYESNEEYER